MEKGDLLMLALSSKMAFRTTIGAIYTQDLFDLPLSSQRGVDLDSVAKAINKEIKDLGEESFVEQGDNKKRSDLNNKLEVVKLVIAHKQAINKANAAAAEKRQKVAAVKAAIVAAKDAALANSSLEDLEKQLKELEAE